MFGDFSSERRRRDRKATEDEFFGLGIELGEKTVLGLSIDEAERLAEELKTSVDVFKTYRREKFDPEMAKIRLFGHSHALLRACETMLPIVEGVSDDAACEWVRDTINQAKGGE